MATRTTDSSETTDGAVRTRRFGAGSTDPAATEQASILFSRSDLGAVWLAVFAGIGTTLMLVILGMAVGFTTIEQGEGTQQFLDASQLLGWWTVASGIIGAFVGGLLGGRASSMMGKATPIAHGVGAWGLTVLLFTLLIGMLSLNVLGTTATAAGGAADAETIAAAAEVLAEQTGSSPSELGATLEEQFGTEDAAAAGQSVGDASWWIFGFLVLALVGSIAGWFVGGRSTPLAAATYAHDG